MKPKKRDSQAIDIQKYAMRKSSMNLLISDDETFNHDDHLGQLNAITPINREVSIDLSNSLPLDKSLQKKSKGSLQKKFSKVRQESILSDATPGNMRRKRFDSMNSFVSRGTQETNAPLSQKLQRYIERLATTVTTEAYAEKYLRE